MSLQLILASGSQIRADLLRALTGYAPRTSTADGIAAFVAWFRDYYRL